MLSNTKSMAPITSAKITEATSTKTELLCNSLNLGQATLFLSSSMESTMNFFNLSNFFCFIVCTGGETRTPSQWFWRPLLYQLSYTRKWPAKLLKKSLETNAFLKKLRNAFC